MSSSISPEELKEVLSLLKELREELSKGLPECPDEMRRWSDVEKEIGTSYYKAVELSGGLCRPQRPIWSGEQKCGKCAKDGFVYMLKVVCLGLRGCFLVGEPVKSSTEVLTDLLISLSSYGIKIGAKIYGKKHPEIAMLLQSVGDVEPLPISEDDLAAIKTYLKSIKNRIGSRGGRKERNESINKRIQS